MSQSGGRVLAPLLGLAGAAVVTALTVVAAGTGLAGVAEVPRMTARWSAFVFSAALALRLGPRGVAWIAVAPLPAGMALHLDRLRRRRAGAGSGSAP